MHWNRQLGALLLSVLGILCLFATKAFAIDDPLFLWLGKHLLEHPLDFYGFEVNWYGTSQGMHAVTMNPPLAGYFIALVGSLTGFSELALHIAFLIPAAAVCVGTYRLAEGLCSHPLLAGLIGLLTPVFLVSSTSVMCDTLMLAFWCWSIHWWRQGIRAGTQRPLVAAALLASCAILTKYFGLALLPMLCAYGFLQNRRPGKWLLPLLIPVGVAIAYELVTASMYGHGLISGARDYAVGSRGDQTRELWPIVLTGVVFFGGCGASVAFFWPLLFGVQRTLAGLGLLVVVAVLLPAPHLLIGVDLETVATMTQALDIQILLMAGGGLGVLWLAGRDLWSRRDPDSALLFLWIGGTFVFATFVNWVNNGRSNLPMAPALGILLVRRLEQRGLGIEALSIRHVAPALVPSIALAVLVTYADFRTANQSRRAAAELTRQYQGSRELYFHGHWGFQYYAELEGARSMDPRVHHMKPGDRVIQPIFNSNAIQLPSTHVKPLRFHEYLGLPWVHTIGPGSAACFYASNIAPMPFAIGFAQLDGYNVWEVTKNFAWRAE